MADTILRGPWSSGKPEFFRMSRTTVVSPTLVTDTMSSETIPSRSPSISQPLVKRVVTSSQASVCHSTPVALSLTPSVKV